MAVRAPGLLLDTHSWVWLRFGLLTGKPETITAIRQAAADDNWFVCSFCFYEIAHAVHRKRLHLDVPLFDWLQTASTQGMPTVLDLTPEIAAATYSLPAGFHGDPGDRIVAATAVVHGLTICTHDKALLHFSRNGLYRTLKINARQEYKNAR